VFIHFLFPPFSSLPRRHEQATCLRCFFLLYGLVNENTRHNVRDWFAFGMQMCETIWTV